MGANTLPFLLSLHVNRNAIFLWSTLSLPPSCICHLWQLLSLKCEVVLDYSEDILRVNVTRFYQSIILLGNMICSFIIYDHICTMFSNTVTSLVTTNFLHCFLLYSNCRSWNNNCPLAFYQPWSCVVIIFLLGCDGHQPVVFGFLNISNITKVDLEYHNSICCLLILSSSWDRAPKGCKTCSPNSKVEHAGFSTYEDLSK